MGSDTPWARPGEFVGESLLLTVHSSHGSQPSRLILHGSLGPWLTRFTVHMVHMAHKTRVALRSHTAHGSHSSHDSRLTRLTRLMALMAQESQLHGSLSIRFSQSHGAQLAEPDCIVVLVQENHHILLEVCRHPPSTGTFIPPGM